MVCGKYLALGLSKPEFKAYLAIGTWQMHLPWFLHVKKFDEGPQPPHLALKYSL